ncbi:RecQ family ATP-dependent DNA helicase [Periweissella beninensis]|uniref:ATP-dependent DNA helicase RecQ n=1 Tax=Periweissella beninensis TaxID=504936 RepID=A0ABT0VNH2_9LACO|nr:RecQ family ATP-dependent DNA helicase [Periweissella beninensis]MBM7544673.1 ATP-dependent DNA helicase RecQ [Periweissella beninensis]MCM2437947.1 ATP-dependent DNA helicase RecQ [Periweissella beninensis]
MTDNDLEQTLIHLLQTNYGYATFRKGQLAVLKTLLATNGQNVLAILPTGTGKSLLYEIAGRYLNGTTVIVSPLLSLMQDQVARLNYHGLKQAVAINSMMTPESRQWVLQNLRQYQYIFIAPESLNQPYILEAIRQQCQVKLLVIDEAHSIVQWGPDFRPSYLLLGTVFEKLNQPRLLALTATASQQMQPQIMAQFKQPFARIQASVNRPKIHLRTERLINEEAKQNRLLTLIKTLPGAGIVYLSSKRQANELVAFLQKQTDKKVAVYHGDLANDQRYAIQQQFMRNQIDIIIATSAFGMGIDKSDIRWIIHYHLPSDLASYLQEIGRAGRDQQAAIAILLYQPHDEVLVQSLINNTIPTEAVITQYYQGNAAEIDHQTQKVLSYYQRTGQQAPEVIDFLAQRLKQRLKALKTMLTYIDLQVDKRNFILTAFGEARLSGAASENWSTEATTLDVSALLKVKGTPVTKRATPQKWSQVLKTMFNSTSANSNQDMVQ